jgi:hypothetical protein
MLCLLGEFINGCVTMLTRLSLLLLQAAHRKHRVMRPAQHPTLRQSPRLRLQLLQQDAFLSTKSQLHWQDLQLLAKCQMAVTKLQQQQIQRLALQDSFHHLHSLQQQQQQLLLLEGDRWLGRLEQQQLQQQQVLVCLHLLLVWQQCAGAAVLQVVLRPWLKVSAVCRSDVLYHREPPLGLPDVDSCSMSDSCVA